MTRRSRASALAVLVASAAVALGGCAVLAPLAEREMPDGAAVVELESTPFHPQEAYQCGPAALATVLNASGVAVLPEALVEQVYLPAREGSLQAELVAATRRHDRLPWVVGPDPAELLAELLAGRPVLVLQNLALVRDPVWHYAVVIGFDTRRDQFILRTGVTERALVPARRFLRTWGRAGSWALVALRPGELPARADRDRYLRAVAGLESAGRHEAARASWKAALERWPDAHAALFGLANAHHALGQNDAAESAYRELLLAVPDHAPAHHNLALVLAGRGCMQAARRHLDAGAAVAPAALEGIFAQSLERLAGMAPAGPDDGPGC